MAYHLFVNNLNQNKTSENIKERRPISLRRNGKLTNSFKIEDIDSLLCQYKSSDNLIKALKHYGYIDSNEDNAHLLLALSYKGEYKKIPIFYNDPFLANISIQFRKVKMSKNNKENKIERTEELKNFIKYIKSLAVNKTTRDFILNPNNIEYLEPAERKKLQSYFPKEITHYGRDCSKEGIGGLLQEYVIYIEKLDELYKKNESTSEISECLNIVNKEIEDYFRSNYLNIRRIIEWENVYQKIVEKHYNFQDVDERHVNILGLQLDKIKTEKINRSGTPVYDDSVYIDETELYDAISDIKDKKISNEKMEYLYKNGGSEEVFNYMDADELYSDNNIKDSENIGIISRRK